ncbi:MAG TPA: DOMON-like domain-containing protein [Rhizomicrobium sp.]|nr:DOMON-like domain-containing protein [Rhizomicrobium sp.]
MRQILKLHPDSHCDAVRGVAVEAARIDKTSLRLRYRASGVMKDLRIPPPGRPARTDALWQHTCFEAFLRPHAGDAYLEFNFAPSTEWAAYSFASYRSEMRVIADAGVSIDVEMTDEALELVALLEGLPADAGWRVGLSAVMEETNGRRSYWALAHPPGRPDFHHGDCFALELG